jgi:UDP-3-O-[3-hydroxymyristoyl] glucosamine N-acyltransferase
MPISSVKSKCNDDLENISNEDSSNFSELSEAKSKKAIKQLDLTKAKAPVITQTHQPQPKDKMRKSIASSTSKLSKKMQAEHAKFQSKVVQISLEELAFSHQVS